jgi:c-di-GMP-binding flagellar brake protein YcgR
VADSNQHGDNSEGENADVAALAQYVPDFEVELAQSDANTFRNISAVTFNPAEFHQIEHRSHPRYLVGWRVAIVNKNSGVSHTYYGRVYDVSLGGVNIWSENNLNFSDSVILLLALPARVPGNRPKIIEIAGESLYTVLTANKPIFRIGFRFVDFKTDNKAKLAQYLERVPRITLSGE